MQKAARRQAVFLDRDGTIARYMEYCRRPQEFRVLPGVGQAIRRLNQAGFLVVVATNQSAIARGWLTLNTLEAIHQKMRRELKRFGAWVDAIYVCPHHPDEGCPCRKPKIGMFQQAAEELDLLLADSYVVGDRWLDVRSGRAAGSTTILVRTGHPVEPANDVIPDCTASTLREAVEWIFQQEGLRVPQDRRRPSVATVATPAGIR